MSRDVVRWSFSDTGSVDSKPPPGLCSTKPRSVCTGPPSSTFWRETCDCEASRPSCSNTSPRSIVSGRLMMMPSAPRALCSQTSVTVCAKFGSSMPGIAIRNWLFRKVAAMPASIRPPCFARQAPDGSRRVAHDRAVAQPAIEELPFIGETEHRVALTHRRGERVERRGQAHDDERRVVELAVAARATHDDLVEASVRADRDLENRIAGHAAPSRLVREVERADSLHSALPAVEIACDQRFARVGEQPVVGGRVATEAYLLVRRGGIHANLLHWPRLEWHARRRRLVGLGPGNGAPRLAGSAREQLCAADRLGGGLRIERVALGNPLVLQQARGGFRQRRAVAIAARAGPVLAALGDVARVRVVRFL